MLHGNPCRRTPSLELARAHQQGLPLEGSWRTIVGAPPHARIIRQSCTHLGQGVVYGCVASEHKGPKALNQKFVQWAREGDPTPHLQFPPERWQQEGFARRTRLTGLELFDLCKEHNLTTEAGLWTKAEAPSEAGDRGLLAFLLENDYQTYLAKVTTAA